MFVINKKINAEFSLADAFRVIYLKNRNTHQGSASIFRGKVNKENNEQRKNKKKNSTKWTNERWKWKPNIMRTFMVSMFIFWKSMTMCNLLCSCWWLIVCYSGADDLIEQRHVHSFRQIVNMYCIEELSSSAIKYGEVKSIAFESVFYEWIHLKV